MVRKIKRTGYLLTLKIRFHHSTKQKLSLLVRREIAFLDEIPTPLVAIGQLFNIGISYGQGTHESSENPKFVHLLSFIPPQILKVHIKPESSKKKKILASFDKKGKLLKPFPCLTKAST